MNWLKQQAHSRSWPLLTEATGGICGRPVSSSERSADDTMKVRVKRPLLYSGRLTADDEGPSTLP